MNTNPYASSDAEIDLSEDRVPAKIFSMGARIGRIRYLAYGFLYNLVFYVPIILLGVLFGAGDAAMSADGFEAMGPMVAVAGFIWYAVILFAAFVLMVRRLHDLDQRGWWCLLMIVPLVNLGLIIYLVFFPGTSTQNRFGKPLVKNKVWEWILGLAMPFIAILGILAAIAIPAYQDYSTRAKTASVIAESDNFRPAIAAVFASEGSFTNADSGYGDIPAAYSTDILESIVAEDGMIIMRFNQNAPYEVAEQTIIFEPRVIDERVVWSCSFTGPKRLAPSTCRN